MRRNEVMRKIVLHKSVVGGAVLVGAILAAALMASWLAPHDPLAIDLSRRLEGPSTTYLLGTDNLGRCLLSRLFYGARITLGAGYTVSLLMIMLGLAIGLFAGLAGGKVDAVTMRLVDMCLAFPSLILALAIVGTLGPSLRNAMVAVTAVWWAGQARLVRGLVLTAKEKDFVLAARVIGARGFTLVGQYILPQIIPILVVMLPLEVGKIILVLSGLSFLGLGAQAPLPEWGAMLNEARPFFQTHPRLMLVPGGAIFTAVLGLNLLSEGLRDILQVKKPLGWVG